MEGIHAGRFKASTVFGIDLADILSSALEDQRRLQEKRASEQLWTALVKCLTSDNGHFGQWIDEADRIGQRMRAAERKGGKEVWQHRFLSRHSPLVLVNHNYGFASSHYTREGNNLDPTGARYRRAFLQNVNYRLTREGVLVATYEVDFRDAAYTPGEVIDALARLREDAFNTFCRFLVEYFGEEARRNLLGEATGLSLSSESIVRNRDAVIEATHFHSLVVIERFIQSVGGEFKPVPLEEVVLSRELAGILNEATWYPSYSSDYCMHVGAKQFGFRNDEIYVIDRRTTVIVAERCWQDDPMTFYLEDLHLVIEHHVAAIALVMQQLAFFREYDEIRLIEVHEPHGVLPLVLAARSNLTLLHESLDFTSLIRHGFTRLFAQQLRHEMEFERAIDALSQRIADMSEAVTLKSSVQSAQASLARASRNNLLQTLAVVLALVALILSILLHGFG